MADIGEKLRSAREAKGLTISDIEKATKIQSRYLTAIEQNDFDKLPGDFYVRAFIRQYAQIVGLDGKELLSDFHKDVPDAKPDEYVENSIDNKSEEVRETTDNKKNLWKNYMPRIAVGLGVIVVVLIIYAVYTGLSSSRQNNTADNNVTVNSQTTSKKPSAVKKKNTVKIVKVGYNQYRVTGLKKNRKLTIKAGDQSVYASISVNGNQQFGQTLNAAQKHTVILPSDATSVQVNFGNDTGTSVKIGGKRVPYQAVGSNLSLTLLIGKPNKDNNNSQSNQSNSYSNSNTQSSQSQSTRSQSSNTQSSQSQSSQSQSNQSSNTADKDDNKQ